MPYNGTGTFIRTDGVYVGPTVFQQERDAGEDILALNLDTEAQDMADGLTNAVTRDGQSPPTANLPMGGFILTGLGSGTARTTSINLGQVQDGATTNAGTFGGTANALTASLSPTITAYATRMRIIGTASASVTGASTLALNGISSPPSIRKKLASGLAPTTGGEWIAGQTISFTYDGTFWVLDDKPEWQASAPIASAATIDLATSTGEYVQITGNTGPVTSLGTLPAATTRTLLFASTPTLTNSAAMILPGGANITVAAGDTYAFTSEGSGNWRVTSYSLSGGGSVVGGTAATQTQVDTGTATTVYVAPNTFLNAAALSTALENRVINPEGAIFQRGIVTARTGTTDNTYGIDRYRLMLAAANAATVSQVTGPSLTTAAYAIRLTVGSGNNNKFGLLQPIENIWCRDLIGLNAVMSAQIKATAGLSDIRMAILQWTGTADAVSGDPISAWNAAGTPPTLAANWAYVNTPVNLSVGTSYARFSVTGTISGSMTNLAIFIWNDDTTTTQTTDQLEMTQIELKHGIGAAPYRIRPITQEDQLCRRYYWRLIEATGARRVVGVGYNSTNSNCILGLFPSVAFRTTSPTVATDGAAGLTLNDCVTGGNNATGVANGGAGGPGVYNISVTAAGTLTANGISTVTVSGNDISIDAEL